ncbi:restriction endonuclease [Streptomyces sp. DH12]|uniref:restriction endonuclease n=1 Tax=Streptomyces sp. DH12 TaxID=2857010 RepID=UPI001E54C3E9|nr:restriction endonuclease [Streptomyces sp. DH12]
MSRHSGGLVGIWAEAQRRQQRAYEEQAREQREAERRRRAHEREVARGHREQRAAYRRQREADAARRTQELEARVEALTGLLAAGCRAPAFRAASLARPESVAPYAPGALAHPVPLPGPSRYDMRGGRRAQAETRARYERDRRAAQAAEAQRVRQLEAYRQQYERWAAAQLAEVRRHNAGVAAMVSALRSGDPDAAVEYFSAALYASPAWPAELPRQVSAAYDPAARQLVLDWELPGYDVVPAARSVRYMPTADQEKETARPAAQRRAVYRDVVAQCVLLVTHELFAADEFGALESVAVNGFVDDHDPVTGRRGRIFLASAVVPRPAFAELYLAQVNAPDCLVDGLGGQLSARPDQRAAVRPVRVPGDVGDDVVTHGGDGEEPDLYEMDPIRFEALVAELFRAMGMEAVTTRRSNDGGVDVAAVDPAPIRGGRIVVQVKRYRNTVPPTAVRDLYGTVQDAGANKGVLVTTSGFGPGSRTFAHGKPLELVSGGELVELLHRHGLRGRLGDGGRPAPARRTAPDAPRTPHPPRPARAAGPGDVPSRAGGSAGGTGPAVGADAADGEANVLGLSWAGPVALDVCALVCRGGRVLDDDHFVFYNNPGTPDGSVRATRPVSPDRAAVRVAFDALPAAADRVVLVAATDPEVDPRADLTGFTEARLRLLDTAGGELGRLEVSDGRPGETALVLGSFRRRANGDWDFVPGGKGYRDGLAELIGDHGVDVA